MCVGGGGGAGVTQDIFINCGFRRRGVVPVCLCACVHACARARGI